MIISRKSAEEAAKLLRVELAALSAEAIQDAYRAMAKLTHPDAGGSPEQFAAVDRAKHVLIEWSKRPVEDRPVLKADQCSNCGGTGRARTTRGFRTFYVMCLSCRGSGDANYDNHGEE